MLQRVFHLRLCKHVSDSSMTWVVVFEDYFLKTRTKWPGSQRSVLKAWEEHEDHTSAWELLPSQLQLLGCSVSCLCGRKQGPETLYLSLCQSVADIKGGWQSVQASCMCIQCLPFSEHIPELCCLLFLFCYRHEVPWRVGLRFQVSRNWVSFRTQENGALCCFGSVTRLSACPLPPSSLLLLKLELP